MPGKRKSRSNHGVQGFLRSLFQSSARNSPDPEVHQGGGIVKWLGIFLIIPPILNFGALQREEREMKASRFDIGFNQNMYMNCSGEGLPTVILDAPIGMTSDVWAPLISQLEHVTRVCVFDRPGLGRSDSPKIFNASDPGEGIVGKVAGAPYSSLRTVHDLHRLLAFSFPQKQPFILVGSELGAVNMLMYSKIHEEQVSGLILINPMTESMFEENDDSWSVFKDSTIIPWLNMLKIGAMTGLNRLAVLTGIIKPFKGFQDKFPSEVILREKHHLCNPQSLNSVLEEYQTLPLSMDQLKTTMSISLSSKKSSLRDVTVMTGNYYDELYPPFLNQAWSKSAQDLIDKIPGCSHLVINGANRSLTYTHPQEVATPILRMVRKYRINSEKSKI